jgi:hypothetical protein
VKYLEKYVFCKLAFTFELWYIFWGRKGDGEGETIFKLQKKVIRLITNVGRVTCGRELFKTLNMLAVPCMYKTEIVCCIKLNVSWLE